MDYLEFVNDSGHEYERAGKEFFATMIINDCEIRLQSV